MTREPRSDQAFLEMIRTVIWDLEETRVRSLLTIRETCKLLELARTMEGPVISIGCGEAGSGGGLESLTRDASAPKNKPPSTTGARGRGH